MYYGLRLEGRHILANIIKREFCLYYKYSMYYQKIKAVKFIC